MKIKINDNGDIVIGIRELLGDLDEEQKKEMAHFVATDDETLDAAIDYLCGEDSSGWWSSHMEQKRHGLLVRIEEKQLGSLPKYGWTVWEEVRKQLQAIREKQHIYWSLYHDAPDHLRNALREWFKSAGVASDYTTKQADDDIKRVEAMIKDALAGMVGIPK